MLTFGVLTFMAVVGVTFMLSYNFGIVDVKDAEMGALIGTSVTGVVLGGVAAYFLSKFAKRFGVALLAAWSGATLAYMALSPTSLNNYVKLVITVLVASGAVYLGYKFNNFIKAMATAIIGSGLLMMGIGSFAGGFPPLIKLTNVQAEGLNTANWSYLGYVAGFIAVSVIGTIVQLKFIGAGDDVEEDDMMKQDFS